MTVKYKYQTSYKAGLIHFLLIVCRENENARQANLSPVSEDVVADPPKSGGIMQQKENSTGVVNNDSFTGPNVNIIGSASGKVCILDKMCPHHFETDDKPLVVIPLHVWSSVGPSETNHPMFNGTHMA